MPINYLFPLDEWLCTFILLHSHITQKLMDAKPRKSWARAESGRDGRNGIIATVVIDNDFLSFNTSRRYGDFQLMEVLRYRISC